MWTRLKKRLQQVRRRRGHSAERAAHAALAVVALRCLRRKPTTWQPREMRDWLT